MGEGTSTVEGTSLAVEGVPVVEGTSITTEVGGGDVFDTDGTTVDDGELIEAGMLFGVWMPSEGTCASCGEEPLLDEGESLTGDGSDGVDDDVLMEDGIGVAVEGASAGEDASDGVDSCMGDATTDGASIIGDVSST